MDKNSAILGVFLLAVCGMLLRPLVRRLVATPWRHVRFRRSRP